MKKSLLFFLPLAILMFSCGSGDDVEISFKEFGDEITVTQNLTIEFNKDLASVDQLNQWDSTKYIRFEPPIDGAFNWESANRLVFSPSDKLPPATQIKGTVTKAVLAGRNDLSLGNDISFQVQTTPLSVFKIAAYWARLDATSKDEPTVFVDLNFNFPVKVSELGKKLGLKVNGKEKSITIQTEEEYARTIRLYSEKTELSDETIPVVVTLQPGILPFGGNQPTSEVKTVNTNLTSPFQFKVTNVSANYDGSKGTLTIITSQAPQEDGIDKYLEIVPKVKFEVESTNNGFVIKSEDFDISSKYELVVKKGIEGKVGGLLKGDYREQFSFGNVKPTIKFVGSKARFLSKEGYKNVKIQILNVKEVEVTVFKLYENNALNFLSTRGEYYDYDLDEYYYGYNYSNTNSMDEVWKKTINSTELPREGSNSILNLDFEDNLSNYNGIYVVQVRSSENRWLRDSRVISISDIGLIAKRGKEQLYIFANSLATAEPIANATVTTIGRNNQEVGKLTTNARGAAVFDLDKNMPNGFQPQMIAVSYNGDYNLIDLGSTSTRTSRYDVGGKYLGDSQYEGFIFMERDLYRPGENVSFAFIVRDRNWGLPGEIPVKVKVVTPDGREFINLRKTLGKQGSAEGTFALPTSSLTGNYNLTLYTSNNKYLTSQQVKVEEFLPDRIKVEASLDKKEYLPADIKMNLDLSAVNFFGPPAANKNYEVRVQFSRSGFYPKSLRGYNFNFHKTNAQLYDIRREGVTNGEGKASMVLDMPSSFKNSGIINLNGYVTVFDETGRPVSVRKTAKIVTQDVFYGIKSDDYWVKTGDVVAASLVATDKDGNVLDGQKATVKVVKHEYKTVLSKSGGYYRYRSQPYERVIEDKEITISGKETKVSFIPDLSGKYEVRVFPEGVNNYIKRDFYAYGYGSTTVNSFEVDNEGEVDIIFDKEEYKPGEKAKVILKAPFSGSALITIENDNVQDYFYVETLNKSAQFELDIKDTYLPNVFLSATLFKPQQSSDIPLTVAHGYAPIKVEKSSNKLDIQITAIEKSRSNQKQRIKLKTQPGAMVGLAIVDEGILQVSQYKTPDPYRFFYGKRALEVSSYDLYPYLFPEVSVGSGLTGGGADLTAELSSRINPLNNQRVKLVSFWKGIAQADSKGVVEQEIDIPQFSGDLRIMAIAFNNQAFGNGVKNMKVADPIVISPGIPRFLSPGDSLLMPVAISNTTDKPINSSVTIGTGGFLKLAGKANENLQLPAGKETTSTYKLYAPYDIGQDEIKIGVKADGDDYDHLTDITVRPNSPLQKLTGSGVIKGAKNTAVSTQDLDFIPSTINRKLVVSKSPMVEFTKDLSYLLRYPYGCLEQTTSQGFPLLYYSNVSKAVMNTADHEERNSNYIVNEVIKRLYLMQLYNGGFAYWPGNGRESFWGSAYATHFLVEAQRAGYEVDANVLSKAISYLKKKANEKKVIDYYYTYTSKRPIYPRGNLYSLYVLALAGDAQLSTMNFYLSKQKFLTNDSKYLLSAAYALSGDKTKINTLIQARFTPESQIRSTGGSFYSPLRDEAIALTALLDVDPEHEEIPIMAKHVSESLKGSNWYSTQERAFSLIALGKIAREALRTNITADVQVGGQTIGSFENTKEPLTLEGDEIKGDISITTKGDGTLYYFWETEGMSKDGSFIEEDSYLQVRRTYYHENGTIANLSNIKQNDRLIVKLSINNVFDKRIENIVITDMLPACFEVENPRIGALPAYRWIKNPSTPEYSDFRDDRVHLFTDLNYSTVRNYYYMVRAVSKGVYNLGPVAADAMYNNEYHSYNGGGKVTVK